MPRDEIVARVGPALAAVGLAGFESRDPTSLSGGEKQRLAIAAVLALRPQLIVFDEPTTDLDPEGRAEVLALIHSLRGQGLALVVIEHEAEELRECDRLLLMREGKIVAQGPPHELLNRFDLLEECGVRPPDLNRALAMLDVDERAAGVDAAERSLRAAGFAPAPAAALAATPAIVSARPEAPILVETHGLSFAYRARAAGPRYDRSQAGGGRVRRDRRPERLGQDDPGQAVDRSAEAVQGPDTARRTRSREPHHGRERARSGLRLPESRSSDLRRRRSSKKSPSGRAISVSTRTKSRAVLTRCCTRSISTTHAIATPSS